MSNDGEQFQAENSCAESFKQSISRLKPHNDMLGELRIVCTQAFKSALLKVQPQQRIRDVLKITDGKLMVRQTKYELKHNIHLVAFGKAALSMVIGAEDVLQDHIVDGIASVPRGTLEKIPKDRKFKTVFYEGATNNLPDEDSCQTATKIELLAKRLNDPNDLLLALVSGGGSALLSAPLHTITLQEKLDTIVAMTSQGANIKQLNVVRKSLSRLKGGKLSQIANPAKVLSLIVSDIVGDPLDLIASGPTVLKDPHIKEPHPTEILKRLGAWKSIPLSVQHAFENLLAHADEQRSDIENIQNMIIVNNQLAISSIKKTLDSAGFSTHIASTTIEEDARTFGKQLASIIEAVLMDKKKTKELRPPQITRANLHFPDASTVAIIFGGECTVNVVGKGKGGRNQEIVLSALIELLKVKPSNLLGRFALLSGGTDGQDGPTDAAGAILTTDDLNYIWEEGRWQRSDLEEFLSKNDSYNFWKVFRDGACHIKSGPTGTNVMDLQILLFQRNYDIFTL